jgi:hypothetical protein
MSNGRSELFTYLGAAFSTAIGLFVVHQLYASYIDVKYHERLAQAGPNEAVLAARDEDQKQLAKGKMPLDQAMQLLTARGRGAFASIAPAASEDLSALSGWIRHPSFKPVVAHPIRTPRAPVVAAPPPEAAEVPPAEPVPAAPQPKRRPAR